MMKRQLLSIARTFALCALLVTQISPTFAQEDLHPAPSETIHLKVGDIFEILPIHDIPDATYTWILTQDRTFLEANRAPSFRKRLIQPGMYTLYAEIASGDGSRRISRTISLDYSARQPGEAMDTSTNPDASILVRTEPAADSQGRVGLSPGTQLVELLPVNPDVVPLALDLDLAKDADGDGKADNDIQADDTFFHSDATPLFLWITDDPLTTHSISITAAGTDGARTQKLDILNAEIAKAEGVIKSPVHIETQPNGERSYSFAAVFENPDAAAGQLLYQWQFGDGQQSLVTKPQHTYAEDGTYAVSLLIRNLRDGSEVASTSLAVNVSAEGTQPSSESSSVASEPTTTPSKTSGVGMGSILTLVGIFLLSLLLGVEIIFLIGKLRRNKTTLADKLESMEKKVVASPAPETPNLTIAPPLATQEKKLQEPPASISEREKELAVEPRAPQPAAKQETAPAWLTSPAPKPAPSAPTAPATPIASGPTKPAPTPVQAPKAAPAQPATPAQAPGWLQTPTTPTVPTPVPAPKPAPSPQQTKQPTTPAAPAWLQQPAAPATTPAPQTEKPTPSVQTQKPAASTPSISPVPKPPSTPVVKPNPAPQKPQQPAPPVVPFDPSTLPKPKPVQQPSATPATSSPAAKPPAPTEAPMQPGSSTPTPQQAVTSIASTPKPTTPVEMDIPPSADQPIAIIRAESLNPPEGNTSA